MIQPTFMFMGNGSPDNGGCEAITKGTIEILRSTFNDASFIDSYFDYTGCYGADKTKNIYPVRYPARWTSKWFLLQPALRFSYPITAQLLYTSHKKQIQQATAVLSLGGDNYSLDYGVPKRFIAMGKYVKRQKVPFIIWGASIGPFERGSTFEKEIATHLRNEVDLILLREEESRKYLEEIGVTKNVKVVADPAFMMQPETCEGLRKYLPSGYICINFSDLMAKYVTNGDMNTWIQICATIINSLHKEYERLLVFIPHVKSDYAFIQKVVPLVSKKELLYIVDTNLNAAQMKWIISQAECNVACRTHSTIASFSTSVPTLSLGYSIKSKGLNQQMYRHENYLLYGKEITCDNVNHTFHMLWENKMNIRKLLSLKNKEVKEQALLAGEYLKRILMQNSSNL